VLVALTERRHRQLNAAEIITAAAWRQRTFPSPVNADARHGGEHEHSEDDKQAFQNAKTIRRRGVLSTTSAEASGSG
jgi:hypothetical protein